MFLPFRHVIRFFFALLRAFLVAEGQTLRRKKKKVSFEEKANLIRAIVGGLKNCDVSTEHGILASTLSTILRAKDAIVLATSSGNASKKERLKTTLLEKLEEAFLFRFNDMRARNIPRSGEAVRQKVHGYAHLLGVDGFKASLGRPSHFKELYGILGKVLSGESSVNERAALLWI